MTRGSLSCIPSKAFKENPFYEIKVAINALIEIQKAYGRDSREFQTAYKMYKEIADMYKWTQG